MKIAVLGVGLIGGSIGLAARRRIEAEVAGYDPDPEIVELARRRGALDSVRSGPADACRGAEIVFCAAPVGALPELVGAALEHSGDGCVVTDVGSTKRQLATCFASAGRFVGGHPLAGAESAGVQNARADLFEGARWYLTPSERAEGLLYDRLQRTIADFGARPQAIDAETHDRMMATVSHLPHVLANALVERAAEALADGSERLPEVGPSFRDSARVAGANPAIWADIFASNREALAAEIDAVVERLRQASALLRGGDPEAVGKWQSAAAERRRRLLEAELVGGALHELRISVPNRPGIVAEIALALGNAGVNIEDMSLSPAADMHTGAVSVWIAGDAEADRAAELVRELGHSASLVVG